MAIDWENFLDPYIQAVGELKIKLRGIRKQYRKQQKHSPIEFVTGRVKPIESIREKMIRRDPRGSETTAGYARGSRARLHPPQEIKWLPELPRRGRVSGRYH